MCECDFFRSPNSTPSYYSVQFHVYRLLIAPSIIDNLNMKDCMTLLAKTIDHCNKNTAIKNITNLQIYVDLRISNLSRISRLNQ